MPRGARQCPGGLVYHVLNRGNDRKQIFHKRGDAAAFLRLMAEAKQRVPMRLLAWCLMSNHWHLVLWPHGDADVSAFMAWLGNAHVRRYRQHYHTNGHGHLYQGRFKSFPVGRDRSDLQSVIRYVEANPFRAGLVQRAEDWPWSSLHHWLRGPADPALSNLLDPWPVDRPEDWAQTVNDAVPESELSSLRASATRGRPFGQDTWARQTAEELGIAFTLRPRGRPPKADESAKSESPTARSDVPTNESNASQTAPP